MSSGKPKFRRGDRVVRAKDVFDRKSPLMHGMVVAVGIQERRRFGVYPEIYAVKWDGQTGVDEGYLPHGLEPEPMTPAPDPLSPNAQEQDMITGTLRLDGFAGRASQRVEVVGQTPKRLRIRAITRTKLAGRGRWLEVGEVALVPIRAVRDNCQTCGGMNGGVPGNENIVNGRVVCDYCSVSR